MLWYQTIQLISSQFLFYRMKRNKIFFLFQILGLDNTYVNIFFRHKNISQPWDTINTWKIIIQIFRARGKETPADRIKWTNYKKNAPIYEATAAKNSPTSTLPPFRSCKFNVRRADDAFIFYLALVQRGQPVKHSTISTSARHELATSSPYLLRRCVQDSRWRPFVANFYHPYCLPHSFQESFIFIPDFSGRNSSIVRFVDHALHLFLFLFFVYTFVRGMQNGFFLWVEV